MAGEPRKRGVRGRTRVIDLAVGVLVPGYAPIRRGQGRRGRALGGMYVSMLAMAALGWGSPLAGLMVLGAFGVHLRAVSEALGEQAFPGFARGVPTFSVGILLVLGVYGPVLGLGRSVAWVGRGGGQGGSTYLVNRLAFEGEEPRVGDWVCYRTGSDEVGVGRVVARAGQEVQWLAEGLRVDQSPLEWMPENDGRTESLALGVPAGMLVVSPLRDSVAGASSPGLVLVESEDVIGRAWARAYPIWSRRLLL